MKGLTEEQLKMIQKNLRAFTRMLGPVWIEKEEDEGEFRIYFPVDRKKHIYSCGDIEAVDGWLHGCVQGYKARVDSVKDICENKYNSIIKMDETCA